MKPIESPFGITIATSISIRSNPDHKSELLSQLLFGESFKIIHQVKDWLLVKSLPTNLQGWIPDHSYEPVRVHGPSPGDLGCFVNTQMVLITQNDNPDYPMTVMPGSTLPRHPEIGANFNLGRKKFRFEESIHTYQSINENQGIKDLASIFIHSPYLWGGRSVFGIDNSGLIQLVYKMLGINLPCNLGELVKQGHPISFVHDAQAGDLAFFEDKEGEIIHAGIITQPGKIVHCFGSVREDALDHAGIYGIKEEDYLFYLRVINRLT